MILFCILLNLVFYIIAAAIYTIIFGLPENKIVRRIIACGIALCVILAIMCNIGIAIYSKQADKLQETFEGLSLRYNTVNLSTNEYVRYDYYNKVLDYNAEFAIALERSKNIWFGDFYPEGWANNIDFINFQLREDTCCCVK